MSWSVCPPRTDEIQFDEKWAFVYKKEKHCDPLEEKDQHRGDIWDHVAFDPTHRLVLGVSRILKIPENMLYCAIQRGG